MSTLCDTSNELDEYKIVPSLCKCERMFACVCVRLRAMYTTHNHVTACVHILDVSPTPLSGLTMAAAHKRTYPKASSKDVSTLRANDARPTQDRRDSQSQGHARTRAYQLIVATATRDHTLLNTDNERRHNGEKGAAPVVERLLKWLPNVPIHERTDEREDGRTNGYKLRGCDTKRCRQVMTGAQHKNVVLCMPHGHAISSHAKCVATAIVSRVPYFLFCACIFQTDLVPISGQLCEM